MKHSLIIALACALSMTACGQQETADVAPLKQTVGQHFAIGCAVNAKIIIHPRSKANQMVATHFNSIVAENCMKEESLSPREGKWTWADADKFVAFGEANNMRIIGHCLVWHSQAAPWIFTDEEGNDVSREVLIERMHNHIATVVGRYKGRIYGWDVCNECWNSDGTMRDTKWREIIGDDYMELAFRFAHEADPDAELYYNDYDMSKPAKYRAVCQMVRDFQAKGIRIDAVGMQSHNGLTYPDLTDYENAMDSLAATGVKVNITELDINVLPRPEEFMEGGADISEMFKYRPELDPYRNGLPEDVAATIDQRWLTFFEIYKRHEHQIDRVTLWGLSDKDSWLNDWPIDGRRSYGLLFDRNYDPKSVITNIEKLYE